MSATTEPAAELEVWDDLHSERPVAFRLFWVTPGESTGTPAVGYASPGGSYGSVADAIVDGLRRFGVRACRVDHRRPRDKSRRAA